MNGAIGLDHTCHFVFPHIDRPIAPKLLFMHLTVLFVAYPHTSNPGSDRLANGALACTAEWARSRAPGRGWGSSCPIDQGTDWPQSNLSNPSSHPAAHPQKPSLIHPNDAHCCSTVVKPSIPWGLSFWLPSACGTKNLRRLARLIMPLRRMQALCTRYRTAVVVVLDIERDRGAMCDTDTIGSHFSIARSRQAQGLGLKNAGLNLQRAREEPHPQRKGESVYPGASTRAHSQPAHYHAAAEQAGGCGGAEPSDTTGELARSRLSARSCCNPARTPMAGTRSRCQPLHHTPEEGRLPSHRGGLGHIGSPGSWLPHSPSFYG
jgi:hypothetical protein